MLSCQMSTLFRRLRGSIWSFRGRSHVFLQRGSDQVPGYEEVLRMVLVVAGGVHVRSS